MVAEQNILYTAEKGVINFSSVIGFTESRTSPGFTIYYAFDTPIPAGAYRLICDAAMTVTSASDQFRLLFSLPATSDSIVISPLVTNGHYVSNKITLTKSVVALDLYVNSPTTISNLMIVDERMYQAGFTSYQPYAVSNSDLTQFQAEDRESLAEVVDSGAKNLLNFDITSLQALNTGGTWSGNSYTKNGVTFTYNDSTKTISTYGTSTSNTVIFYLMNFTPTSGTSFTISGCPSGGSATGYRLCNMEQTWVNDYGSSDTAVGDGTSKQMANYINHSGTAVGTSSNPLTWKPMLCTKAAFAISPKFVPYAKSNYSLTQLTFGLSDTTYKPAIVVQSRVKDVTGGYIQIGKMVVVNIRCTANETISYSTPFLGALPQPIVAFSTANTSVCLTNNLNELISLLGNGNISTGGNTNIPADQVLILSCVYFTND